MRKHMMKILLAAVVLTLTSTSILASGTHGDSHGHDDAKFSVGEPASGKPDRIFEVSMGDNMRFVFTPEFEDLHDGEVIQFNVKNDGVIVHEFSIGNADDQVEHAKMMREMPGMKHVDPNTVSLESGESATITWRFKGDDTVVFACNVPGHFEAGMHHKLPINSH